MFHWGELCDFLFLKQTAGAAEVGFVADVQAGWGGGFFAAWELGVSLESAWPSLPRPAWAEPVLACVTLP